MRPQLACPLCVRPGQLGRHRDTVRYCITDRHSPAAGCGYRQSFPTDSHRDAWQTVCMDLLQLFVALARQEHDFHQEAAQLLPLAEVVSEELKRLATPT